MWCRLVKPMFWNLNDGFKILPSDSNSEILRFSTDKGQREQKVASGPAEQLAEDRFGIGASGKPSTWWPPGGLVEQDNREVEAV